MFKALNHAKIYEPSKSIANCLTLGEKNTRKNTDYSKRKIYIIRNTVNDLTYWKHLPNIDKKNVTT